MNLLKHTILVALLLLFSFRFAKCQMVSENTEVTEQTTVVEEWIPQADDGGEEEEETWVTEVIEETVTTEETIATEETVVTEETVTTEETIVPEEVVEEEESPEVCEEMPVIEEEEELIEEGSAEEPPQFVEETEVNGHWMTLYPCHVSSETVCSSSYEPVCVEKESCEAGHCRYRYETINNVCNACKGHDNWLYSTGKCPWEKTL